MICFLFLPVHGFHVFSHVSCRCSLMRRISLWKISLSWFSVLSAVDRTAWETPDSKPCEDCTVNTVLNDVEMNGCHASQNGGDFRVCFHRWTWIFRLLGRSGSSAEQTSSRSWASFPILTDFSRWFMLRLNAVQKEKLTRVRRAGVTLCCVELLYCTWDAISYIISTYKRLGSKNTAGLMMTHVSTRTRLTGWFTERGRTHSAYTAYSVQPNKATH